jgi:hypothetical protein
MKKWSTLPILMVNHGCPIQDEAEKGAVILMQDEAEILKI